jgi:hypothetical protein
MTRQKIDTLWFKAMRESIKDGEQFTRYHFANLVAAAEREACAQIAEDFDARDPKHIAAAIRARGTE